VVRESHRIVRLVEAFTDMARMRREGMGLDLKPRDLRSILDLTVQVMQAAYPHHQYRLTTPDRPVWALGDGPAMTTVFSSLLENAAQFSAPGSQVSVQLVLTDHEAVLCVQDEGV